MPPPRRESDTPCPESRGKQVLQLRQFHLQTAFGGAGAAREDIENQLGAVDDLDAGGAFKIALLGGREIVIDDQDVGLRGFGEFLQFLDFSVAQQSGRIDVRAAT